MTGLGMIIVFLSGSLHVPGDAAGRTETEQRIIQHNPYIPVPSFVGKGQSEPGEKTTDIAIPSSVPGVCTGSSAIRSFDRREAPSLEFLLVYTLTTTSQL